MPNDSLKGLTVRGLMVIGHLPILRIRNWASSTKPHVIWLSLRPEIDLTRNPRKGYSLSPDLFRIHIRGAHTYTAIMARSYISLFWEFLERSIASLLNHLNADSIYLFQS